MMTVCTVYRHGIGIGPGGWLWRHARSAKGDTMKILAIIASPRGMKGNTGRLLEEVLHGARECGAETEILSLSSLNVHPCVGCDL